MELGWCDVCLRVANVGASRGFYSDLGFRRVEGGDEDGWAVVTNGAVRLGLFEPQFMGEDAFTLNFRGGDVPAISRALRERGHALLKEPPPEAQGSGSAKLRDPDGHAIFFDTAPGEVMQDTAR